MDDMKLLSTEAEGVNEAIAEEHRKALVNGAGRVGALLGLQSPQNGSSASAADAEDSTGAAPCDLLCRKMVWDASVSPSAPRRSCQRIKGTCMLHELTPLNSLKEDGDRKLLSEGRSSCLLRPCQRAQEMRPPL